MSASIVIKQTHSRFLFGNDESFNAFNLIRLMESSLKNEELTINISQLAKNEQSSIVSNVSTILNLIRRLSGKEKGCVQIQFSSVEQINIEKSIDANSGLQDDKTLIFDLPKPPKASKDKLKPHYVKNVRGAVLLSLATDLINSSNISSSLTFFNTPSQVCLRSAATFLYNEDNAHVMWEVLKSWESATDSKFSEKLNRQIKQCRDLNLHAKTLVLSLSQNTSTNLSNLMYLVGNLQTLVSLPESIYAIETHPQAWFIDDQVANGWGMLLGEMLAELNIEMQSFANIDDLNNYVKAILKHDIGSCPDMAFVDLRLSSEDPELEAYDSADLSGFKVVETLLSQWPGIPIVIASASNKLWNVEKALKKGAIGYWRKSDEVQDAFDKEAVFTALSIYKQFANKVTLAIRKTRFRYVFRLTELLKTLSYSSPICNTTMQRSIIRYCVDAPRKVSLMLWQELDETETVDNLLLGVMELFNEVESLLWDTETKMLRCVPNTEVKTRPERTDKLIINDTFEYLNKKYSLKGIDLEAHYTGIKGIRNDLPIVHGSEATNSAKHATIEDVELSLLLVWVLLNELVVQAET
jgi:CheY-like chemotaxis protein